MFWTFVPDKGDSDVGHRLALQRSVLSVLGRPAGI